jgi:WD40 repeat protein
VKALIFTPDGRTLVSGGGHVELGAIQVWDVATRQATRQLIGHTATVNALALARDGRTLASGSSDRTCRLWDVRLAKPVLKYPPISDVENLLQVTSVAFSPDGKTLAFSDFRDTYLCELATGKVRRHFRGTEIQCLAFSPDGRSFAQGMGSAILRLWDLRDSAMIQRWTPVP